MKQETKQNIYVKPANVPNYRMLGAYKIQNQ